MQNHPPFRHLIADAKSAVDWLDRLDHRNKVRKFVIFRYDQQNKEGRIAIEPVHRRLVDSGQIERPSLSSL